jgi:hypothetical protein
VIASQSAEQGELPRDRPRWLAEHIITKGRIAEDNWDHARTLLQFALIAFK